ncbi:Fe-S cluster domain-containing protein [Segatella bryantii]|jgi:Na+-translocating ferredoxin:NAD+ oxidoreductase RNF subunit RnfB|uniref:Ion-translocating oxidoreductase complex subunit B n=1 Tax=Segatella bryantii TaxID=77095 RepID=A0ABX4EHD5_SEGBR|nr:Fe-S cluster domain-containing protein [Segatella bryantii]MEE3415345.1 Fe-S cluster domain-containing protein [Prevotella sp.]MDR4931436.1 Fe-S cluster domain-containing protein [Segatella bryantii]OYP54708.1 ferredoxin [Segatella bryantii]UKK81704.1 Fe-S cluster domain-containing protein [Segatella bryantii]SDL78913.1 electron transport complex, RnfABCDGE type, B subunit [Segatella bryantii]
MNFILIAVLVLGAIALVAAVILYIVSKKFAVQEDPRIAQVVEILPGANCGGCGFAGCGGLAEALVKGADAGSIEGIRCPVGGDPVMGEVADLLGMAVANTEPMVAVVRCNGTCTNRPRIAEYDGLRTCQAMNANGSGETGCGFGCLGCGDCTKACAFDAIHMNPETGLPEVDEEKCTSCGACTKACPRHIIELRKKGPKGRRVYVQCVNKDKGAVARKSCTAACIGCGKCQKVCKFDAITIENNLSYIDFNKCRMCTKCVDECPTGAIIKVNFPVKKAQPAKSVETVAQPAAASVNEETKVEEKK